MIVFAAAASLRLAAAAGSLSPPPSPRRRWFGPEPVYTILCPLYREAEVAADLVAALRRLDYPQDRLDVKLVLEHDDQETLEAVRSASLPAWIEVVVAPHSDLRTKPRALNVALQRARGAFVAVYDAEDRPHPNQLRAALDAFAAGGPALACVQAPLLIDNARASWIARQFAAEYAIQFKTILPFLARCGLPLALGGTSNHFRIEPLRALGGWDPHNVTEDADIGYRLARAGWTHAVIDPPTYEEAPTTLSTWLRQRSRWIKGHLQTWLVLMRNPIGLYRQMGAPGFWSMQVLLGGGVLAALAHGPWAVYLLAALFVPQLGLPAEDAALAIFGYATGVYAALAAAAAARDLSLIRAVLTMPIYWPLASLAAVQALVELVRRPHYWAKTAHGVSPRTTPCLKTCP